MRDKRPINLSEYGDLARTILPQMYYDYFASGADGEITLADNVEAYNRIKLRYRVMRDVSKRDLAARVLDVDASTPLMIAPTAFHGLATPEAELATARAAEHAGVPMILSCLSNTRLEDVARATSAPLMLQLYIYKDRRISSELVQRAQEAGYRAIVLTVDTPLLGMRERDVHNNFQLPEHLSVANMSSPQLATMTADGGSGLGNYFAASIDASLSWKDMEWLRGLTDLPILLKGIVHPEDARLALENGAAGVIVSNHGARQLDTSVATIEALPAIAEALDGRGSLMVDGGIRKGTDVVKALALGAEAVLVGRPILWGLAVDGEQGALNVLQLLKEEYSRAMALCGYNSTAQLRREGASIVHGMSGR